MTTSVRFLTDAGTTLQQNLIAYWPLNETSGSRADLMSGKNRYAAQFTAANSEYLSRNDSADLSVGDIDFTVAGWVYFDTAVTNTVQVLMSKGPISGSGHEYTLGAFDASKRFYWSVGDGTSDSFTVANNFGDLTTGTWYFVVGWHDSVNDIVGIQINNGTANTDSRTAGSYDTTNIFTIGAASDPTKFVDGRMAAVGFWKKVLTSDEKTSLYNSGSGLHSRDLSGSLLTSLISYWNLSESSGNRYDSIGTSTLTDNNTVTQNPGITPGNLLTDNNTVTQAVGKKRYAAQFTSANSEYLSVADNSDLSTGDIDFTIAGWFYFDSFGVVRGLATKGTLAGTNSEWRLYYDSVSDRFNFDISSDGITSAATAVANNFGAPSTATWYFIAAWHDAAGDTVNIQVNNGTVNSIATSGAAPSNRAGAFEIGRTESTLYMNGRIDEIGFWKKVLTSQERSDLYNSGVGNSLKASTFSPDTGYSLNDSINAYWKMNEASGTRLDALSTNNLTDNNTVTQATGKVGNAGQFTRANSEYLSIADNDTISTGDFDFTYALWFYLDSAPPGASGSDYYMLVAKSNATPVGIYADVYKSGSNTNLELAFVNAGDNAGHDFGAVTTSAWHFLVFGYDATNNRIFYSLDGASVATTNNPTVGADSGGELRFGNSSQGSTLYLDGRIDESGYWKKVLSATEITNLYNSGSGNTAGVEIAGQFSDASGGTASRMFSLFD